MKIIVSLLIFSIGFSLSMKAQELPVFSQYLNSKYYLSPAAVGIEPCSNFMVSHRQQWTGMQDAPHTQGISGFTRLDVLQTATGFTGLGFLLHNDNNGPNNIKRIQLETAYHFTVWKDKIKNKEVKMSMGLAASGFQYKLNEAGLTFIDQGDPLLNGSIQKTNMLNFDAGIMLYNENFTASFTATQIKASDIEMYNNEAMLRYFFYYLSYIDRNEKGLGFQPSVMLKTSDKTRQLDLSAIMYINHLFSFGASYRRNIDPNNAQHLAVMLLLGFDFGEYNIKYSYDYGLSGINQYNYGSHEILLGYRICKKGVMPKYW